MAPTNESGLRIPWPIVFVGAGLLLLVLLGAGFVTFLFSPVGLILVIIALLLARRR